MKLSFSHKKSLFLGAGILIVMSILLFTTCDIGLGPIVNTEKPVINSAGDNAPGAFLQGKDNKIDLDVSNQLGFKIETVYMDVEYTPLNSSTSEIKRIYAQKDDAGKWSVNLDVSGMEDGKITGKVTAIDESGGKATTTEMVYNVKNKLPQIKLTIPSVSDSEFDNVDFLNQIKTSDYIYQGLDLMGLATDDFYIADGFPKIKFWKSDWTDIDNDGIPVDDKFGQWRTVELPLNYKSKSTATKFSWPMVQLVKDSNDPTGWRLPKRDSEGKYDSSEYIQLEANKTYRFCLMIKDGFGNVNYFPNRTDNQRGPNKTPLDPDTAELKYIEVTYKAIDEMTIVQVPDPPRYYNRASVFQIDLSVITSTMITSTTDVGNPGDPGYIKGNPQAVRAYITNSNDGSGPVLGGPANYYYATSNGSIKNPYSYTLRITAEQAQSWGSVSGTLFVALQAKKTADTDYGPTEYQYFNLDETPPKVEIDQPSDLTPAHKTGKFLGGEFSILYPPKTSKPKWVTGSVTAGGRNTDNFGIKNVYFYLGNKLNDDKKSVEELKTFYNTVTWTDTGLGTSSTAPGWSGSVYAWTYTATYPIGYKGNHGTIVQELSELDFVPSDDTNYITLTKERFYLPLYLKVVDVAGNINYVHYTMSIDPLLDEPQINIIYPKSTDTVGGTVRVTGTADDNYWMHTVLMRIQKAGKPAGEYYIPPSAEDGLFYPNAAYPAPMKSGSRDEAGWFKLALVGDGPTVNWTATVNGDAKLNPEGVAETVNVTFEVFAIDTNETTHQIPHIVGPIETRTVPFSSKVPRIENVTITKGSDTRDHKDGISTSGLFTMSMKISATDGINKVLAKVNNDNQLTLMTNNSAQMNGTVWNISTPVANAGRWESTLTVTVDSASTNPAAIGKIPYGSTGVMNLEITVEDKTAQNFTTTNSFRVGIDNLFPYASIETSRTASDDVSAKKYFTVQGEAQDWKTGSEIIQGLERVLVYFEEATIEYSGANYTGTRTVKGNQRMRKPDGTAATTSDFYEYPVMDATIADYDPKTTIVPNKLTGFTIPKFAKNASGVYTSAAAMVIDNNESEGTADYDHDGTYGEKWSGLTDKIWGARMLISNFAGTAQPFADGPYIVHYIIMDQAGNATHYQNDIYVENKKPLITNINIGTDIDFDNTVTDWTNNKNPGEYRDESYKVDISAESKSSIETKDDVFRIRNGRLGLKLNIINGNGNKNLRVSYVSKGTAKSVTTMERGHVYQIAKTAQTTDFTRYGAPNGYTDTVFVASGKGEGEGEVYEFTTKSDNTQTQQFTGLGTSASLDISKVFTGFAGVSDTTTGLFIVKVYDTTLSSGANPEYDQLAHAILLTISVNNTDILPPKIEVSNFGQRHIASLTGSAKNYDDNILSDIANAVYTDYVDTTVTTVGSLTVTTKNGYVQYQAHSTANSGTTGTANISGKVLFNGKVNDNHRIDKITATIPGYNGGNGVGAEFNIATRNTSTNLLQPANILAGERVFKLMHTQAEVPQFSLEYGHTLVWQFMWDSSKVASSAASNVNIIFTVYDLRPSSISVTKNVNIVPYISEVETTLTKAYASNPSAFNRSALGGYPVLDGDTITIKGFNLGSFTANNTNNNVTIGGGTNYVTSLSNSGTTIKGTVSGLSSGPLVVKVNNIDSFNNNSNKTKTNGNWTAPYNQEPNNANNNILDNSRYIYVWNTGFIDDTNPAMVYNPFMRLSTYTTTANSVTTNVRLLSYGYYPSSNNGVLRVRRNNTNIATATANTNRMTNTTVAAATAANITAAGAAITNPTVNASWYAIGSDITAGSYPFRFAKSTTDGTGHGNDINIVANIGTNSNRFKIPRIAVQSTSTGTNNRADANNDRILISYYDDDQKQVYVIYGNMGLDNNTDNIPGTPVIVASNGTVTGTTATTNKASMYTAAGFLGNGLPLLAWYDSVSEKLIFSWGNGAPTSNTYNAANNASRSNTNQGQWQANAKVIDSGKGAHVDMVVDGGNNVHLAYYDTINGGLYYALIPPTGSGNNMTPNTAGVVPVKVDTFLSAGTKIMINVRQETTPTTRYVPYITYAHASFAETRNSVRVAWRTDFSTTAPAAGTDENDTFTGKWEVMTVPVSGVIPKTDEFICNGLPTQSTWVAPTGTGTSTLTYNTNLNQTIIVGYMTDKWYEGAILKGDIRTVPTLLQK